MQTFELIFACGMRNGPKFFLRVSNSSSIFCRKDSPSCTVPARPLSRWASRMRICFGAPSHQPTSPSSRQEQSFDYFGFTTHLDLALFSPSVVLPILRSLNIHRNFRISSSIPTKRPLGFWLRSRCIYRSIGSGRMDIFKALSAWHKHSLVTHVSECYFSDALRLSVGRSFLRFAMFTPKYLVCIYF